jgi:ABC-type dipeptide/oligopeptide/nickel transport system permease subunit
MKAIRLIALSILISVAAVSAIADFISPYPYGEQFRQNAREPPSRRFLLGTDELGRDRLSRLLEGTRISLLCAVIAAAIATAAGGAVGIVAGYFGGWADEASSGAIDLFLSLPWLFALLSLRALLPLNISPWVSIAATFLLLAGVGWAPGARVTRASTANLRTMGPILHARAYGCGRARLLFRHVLPNLKPVLSAQFWILVPVFLLTEANLGVLGLGIAEPLPSLGNMLAELQDYDRIREQPWILAAPFVLVLVVASLHFVVPGQQQWEQE